VALTTVREELDRLFTFWPKSERLLRVPGVDSTPIQREIVEDFEKLRDALFVLADRVDGRPSFQYEDPVRVDLRGFDDMPPGVAADEVEATIVDVSRGPRHGDGLVRADQRLHSARSTRSHHPAGHVPKGRLAISSKSI
jgi:hypothetical protein